ncbi:MAG: Cell envelope-related transcriptional attenuator [Blastococcus sp.]|nr:Cell envelope-related transcriptional attenuator [Blastococcus sp.]
MSTDDTGARPAVDGRPGSDIDERTVADDVAGTPAAVDEPHVGDTDADEPRPRKSRVLRRVLISIGVLGLVLALAIGGGVWYLTEHFGGNIARVDNVFGTVNQGARPAPATPERGGGTPVTFLLVGSDTRSHFAQGQLPDSRSDAIMLVRFTADRQHAQVISIPRDSWVDIPGHGKSKINAAWAWGGPSLLIQTVEQLTQVRIDHFVAIDFDGIIKVTDDLGGVDVVVAATTKWGPYTFPAGVNHLNGDQARWYLGQRHGLQGGDFDRVKRQQQYLRSMFGKLFSSNTFTDPARLDTALLAVTHSLAIDDALSNANLLSLAYSMRNVTPKNVQYFTAPVLGTGREGAASVVYLDMVTGERMWADLRNDSLSENAAEFSKQALPDVPR